VASPGYSRYELTEDPAQIASEQTFPCVLKPLLLSGSRGVIRVDTPETFVEVFYRIGRILQHSPDLAPSDDPDAQRILVESYIPGVEVALEGLLVHGDLRVLAIFDKPDPLEGPYFEETIYVTPSRLPEGIQQAIIDTAEQATRAIGLSEGPVHAELRINNDGPWVIEVAGRSIGGLCSRTLQFGLGISLEELILRQALRLDIDTLEQCGQASGVMMLPIPEGGIFERVEGVEAACQVEGIENMVITAKKGEILKPLPEGGGYPGFLFARGTTPAFVEQALRNAYDCLRLRIKEELPLIKS
jgi:biotin carboxylase